MGIIEVFLVGLGLAMDTTAVSICKGLAMKKIDWKKAIIIALYFGIFQAIMPLMGYLLGETFQEIFSSVDHWVAFILLAIIGANMIKESFENESEKINDRVDFKTMIVLALATSIDALAIGITFSILKIDLVLAILILGLVAFILSLVGVKIGNKFGSKFQNKAEITGGIILILIGMKILLEHLNIF